MNIEVLLEYLVGPVGGFIVTMIALLAVVRGRLVTPKYVLESEQEKNKLLEGEAKAQQKIVLELTRLNAMLGAQVEGLREEVEELRAANLRLEGEIGLLRNQLMGGR